jgi:uncharacterized OsmC-like protein
MAKDRFCKSIEKLIFLSTVKESKSEEKRKKYLDIVNHYCPIKNIFSLINPIKTMGYGIFFK